MAHRTWSPAIAVVTAIMILLLAHSARAALPTERQTEHTLGVSLGYTDYGVADRAATALVYRGTAGAGRFAYVGERAHLRWTTNLGFALGPYYAAHHPDRAAVFGTIDVDGNPDEVRVPMRGRVLVPSASVGLDAKVELGMVSVLIGGTLDYELFYPQGFVSPGLMQSLSAKPALRLRIQPKDAHRIELGATTSIATWVVRMPYHQSVSVPGESRVGGLVRLGSTIQGPATQPSAGVDAGYRYRINHRLGVSARYRFAWLRNDAPRLLTRVEQELMLGLEVYL